MNTFPMTKPSPIATAPRDGTLIRFWSRSEAEPIVGYWSTAFIGWVAYHESIPLIRHDVTECELIEDQAAARTVPLEKLRRPAATVIIVAKRNRHSVRPCHLAAGPASRCSWWAADGGRMDKTRANRRRHARFVAALPTCRSCAHNGDSDLAALVECGRGDMPLIERRWRCSKLPKLMRQGRRDETDATVQQEPIAAS